MNAGGFHKTKRRNQPMKRSGILLGFICLVLIYCFIQPPIGICADIKYPNRVIKFIVGFPAGSASDIMSRKVVDVANPYLNHKVIIENKPGAGAVIATSFVAKSKPDGYTILCLSNSPITTAPFFQKVDFDPINDLTPIIQYATADHALAVPANSPIKTLKDFIEEGRKRDLNIVGAGLTSQEIAVMRLAKIEKLKLKTVPLGSAASAITAVLGGNADGVVVTGLYEYVRSGKMRLIFQSGRFRSKEFPEVPTLKELGYDIESVAFFGVGAPKGLPEPIRKKLEEAFTQGIRSDPSYPQWLESASYVFFYRNGKDFGKYMSEMYERSKSELQELELGVFAKEKK
jgi:tripartite-type tricarboxylate transporter receptor subunit TctC